MEMYVKNRKAPMSTTLQDKLLLVFVISIPHAFSSFLGHCFIFNLWEMSVANSFLINGLEYE